MPYWLQVALWVLFIVGVGVGGLVLIIWHEEKD